MANSGVIGGTPLFFSLNGVAYPMKNDSSVKVVLAKYETTYEPDSNGNPVGKRTRTFSSISDLTLIVRDAEYDQLAAISDAAIAVEMIFTRATGVTYTGLAFLDGIPENSDGELSLNLKVMDMVSISS
jgi:hypothetical protein